MTIIASDRFRKTMPDVLSRIQYKNERFTLTRNGKAIAELVPIASATAATTPDVKAAK